MLGRAQLLGLEHRQIAGDERVGRDAVAHAQRQLVRVLDHREALQVHLLARDVQRRDQLMVGRRGGVREERLGEGLGRAPLEELVPHVDHRCLAERRQRHLCVDCVA